MSESKTQLIFNLVVLGLVLGLGSIVFFSLIPNQQEAIKNPKPSTTSSVAKSSTSLVKPSQTPEDVTKYKSLVKAEVISEGQGETTKAGDKITVNYTGMLQDGTVFDSSVGKAPFDFTLGGGRVIKGWDYGLEGYKVGSKVKLTLPPEIAYGSASNGKIPANSTLVFDVEILGITK